MTAHATTSTDLLESCLHFLSECLRFRVLEQLGQGDGVLPELHLPEENSPFSLLLQELNPSVPELLVLLLALAPELRPGLIDAAIPTSTEHDLPDFGGIRGKQHRGILPTGETARFLIGGDVIGARTQVQSLLTGRLADRGFIRLAAAPEGEPTLAGRLTIPRRQVDWMLTGRRALPQFSPDFPAQLLVPTLDWEDLILTERTGKEIEYLRRHLPQQGRLSDFAGLRGHLCPGYRILFYGPSGTGKTLTAGLLGQLLQRPVFRIDLSMIVSKYIGETEKNLSGLFRRAEREDWILFFDEADALFGKRTDIKDSKDRFANQEVSYLLQRIEDCVGIVVLATNLEGNIDPAFIRRFEAAIPFELPTEVERLRFWRTLLPAHLPLAEGIDMKRIARRYTLTGSSIAGTIRFVVTEALAQGITTIPEKLLLEGISREYHKNKRDWIA